jgi:hypothetical protein
MRDAKKPRLQRIERQKHPETIGCKYFLDWLAFFNEIISEVKRSGMKSYSSRWDVGGGLVRRHFQGEES